MIEEWRPVVGLEGFYEVSNLGSVRSIRTNFGNSRNRLCKPTLTHDGYVRHTLSVAGKQVRKHASHMVLEAFVGARPDGMEACHRDGVRDNNRLSNLRWDTPEANVVDRVEHGAQRGERHHAATIDEGTARQIKAAAADRSRWAAAIAEEFGTTVHVVRNIRNGKAWGWL